MNITAKAFKCNERTASICEQFNSVLSCIKTADTHVAASLYVFLSDISLNNTSQEAILRIRSESWKKYSLKCYENAIDMFLPE